MFQHQKAGDGRSKMMLGDLFGLQSLKQLGLATNSSNVAASRREAALLVASAIKQALLVLTSVTAHVKSRLYYYLLHNFLIHSEFR